MLRAHPLLILLLILGCASFNEQLPLTVEDVAVMRAALADEFADSEASKRLVVLADHTDTWLPESDALEHIDSERLQGAPIAILDQLRRANRRASRIPPRFAPATVQVRPSREVERALSSVRRMDMFAKRFTEPPLIVSVGRPAFSPDRSVAVVTSSVEATWNGCGSFSILLFRKEGTEWKKADFLLISVW